jgi:nitrite reductase/ring-hydroxylating ferredoxin subunit
MEKIGPETELPEGRVTRVGDYAVGNNGSYFAVGRRCRHLGGHLDEGSIDPDGCLVCPWHQAKYDVQTGRMVRGPQGIFAKVPGLGTFFRTLTRVVPLKVRKVVARDGDLFLED